uniref:Uncharacterized protein n=1 Tax=Vibrio anguillarum serovar O2 TaxID=105260 RepID=A4Q8I1_VIBAN|nr:hypothetical protein [Vibrio anguillarum]CAJ87704.1 hypothetical protein [Vibrio anguillarum serovar O2]
MLKTIKKRMITMNNEIQNVSVRKWQRIEVDGKLERFRDGKFYVFGLEENDFTKNLYKAECSDVYYCIKCDSKVVKSNEEITCTDAPCIINGDATFREVCFVSKEHTKCPKCSEEGWINYLV